MTSTVYVCATQSVISWLTSEFGVLNRCSLQISSRRDHGNNDVRCCCICSLRYFNGRAIWRQSHFYCLGVEIRVQQPEQLNVLGRFRQWSVIKRRVVGKTAAWWVADFFCQSTSTETNRVTSFSLQIVNCGETIAQMVGLEDASKKIKLHATTYTIKTIKTSRQAVIATVVS